MADLATARYRLLGEVHDNPAHHAIRGEPVEEPDSARAVRDILQGVSDALGNP